MDNNLVSFMAIHNQRYKTINLSCVENKKLTWKAKGIHNYFITRPHGWTINKNDLIGRSTDGETSLKSGIRELIWAGYLFRFIQRNEKGQITRWLYVVVEEPTTEDEIFKHLIEKGQDVWKTYRNGKNPNGDDDDGIISGNDAQPIDSKEEVNTEESNISLLAGNPSVVSGSPLIIRNVSNKNSDKSEVDNEDESSLSPSSSSETAADVADFDAAGRVLEDQAHPKPFKINRRPIPLNRREAIRINAEVEKYKHQNQEPSPVNTLKPSEEVCLLVEHWEGLGLKATSPDKAPKTYNKNIRSLKKILNGTLIPNQSSLTPDQIKSAMTSYSLAALDADFEPSNVEYKKHLASTSISEFCWNPHAKGGARSHLINYLNTPPKPCAKKQTLESVEDEHPEITKRLRRFYMRYVFAGLSKPKLPEKDENKFRLASKMIMDFIKENRNRIQGISCDGSDLVDLFCEAIQDHYGERVNMVYPGTFCSSFALGRFAAKLNVEGLIIGAIIDPVHGTSSKSIHQMKVEPAIKSEADPLLSIDQFTKTKYDPQCGLFPHEAYGEYRKEREKRLDETRKKESPKSTISPMERQRRAEIRRNAVLSKMSVPEYCRANNISLEKPTIHQTTV